MVNFVYGALSRYFSALKKLGYYSYADVYRLLLLCFYKDLLYGDYRGRVNKDDYRAIERALNCLYGSSCLIPYPEYSSMVNLQLGDMSELMQRIHHLEDTDVVQVITDASSISNPDEHSDVKVMLSD